METLFDQNNETKDYLGELVGEGKKYKDVNELAKAYSHLDGHTKIIQNENREYRSLEKQYLEKQKTLEDNVYKIMDELEKTKKPSSPPTEGKPVEAGRETRVPLENQSNLGPSEIKRFVKEALEEETSQAQQRANLDIVNSEAEKIFGSLEKANEFVKKKAAEIGLPMEDFAKVAMKSPKAFFELAGIKPQEATKEKVAMKNEVNSQNFFKEKPAVDDDTKWEFYSNMRRTNTDKYYSPEVQARIHELVMKGVMTLPR